MHEILAPIQNVQHDGPLLPATLQAIQKQAGSQAIAEIELLTNADVLTGAHQDTDRTGRAARIVSGPGRGEIQPPATLIVTNAVGLSFGGVLVEQGVRGAKF